MGSSLVTKLDDAFTNLSLLGLDTAPFIYFVEQNPIYVDLMREIFGRIQTNEFTACSSVITLTEVLILPLRASNQKLTDDYENILQSGRNFKLLPINWLIARKAANLRSKYNLRTPDALQIATAIDAGCDAFLCNDNGLKRVVEINVLILDDLEF